MQEGKEKGINEGEKREQEDEKQKRLKEEHNKGLNGP
jgi:hypothetical protein